MGKRSYNFRVSLLPMVGAILIVVGSIQESASAALTDLYAICHSKYGRGCVAYPIGRDGVKVREAPKVGAAVIQIVPPVTNLPLLDPFDHDGWIRVLAQKEKETVVHEGWVRRSEIAMAWDFQRVVGCWPVSELTWSEDDSGDYGKRTFVVKTDVDGKVKVDVPAEEDEYPNAKIWFANGMFLIVDVGRDHGLSPDFVLDYPNRQVQMTLGAFGKLGDPPFRYTSDEKLKGCTKIPVVDPTQPMLKKPKEKKRR